MKIQKQIPVQSFRPAEGLIERYQRLVREVMIPYQYSVLTDEAEGVEKSHVVANFLNAAKALRGEDVGDGFYGMVFQDSDAAKWLEAVAYSLALYPDPSLESTADHLIELIGDAQDQDGYLNTYFTLHDRNRRWQNLQEGHELYCAGHMMEAAVAYYEATGKDKFLQIMLRNAEHIYTHFVTEGHEGYPGHPEVELALLRLYRTTGNRHCLTLAKHFIDARGVDPDFFRKERAKIDWTIWNMNVGDYEYAQNAAPVREQTDAMGHAVRAVYLYTAMADLSAETDDAELKEACDRLWESITGKRMYITGGIGSTAIGEAFTVDYDLPGDTAYAETCASIGLMFFASRMLEISPEAKYADTMERAFYNTVLAGMQLDGKKFFYVNPLETVPGITGKAATQRHVCPVRPNWYSCACCPPNLARIIMSIGKYAYGASETRGYCHLYADGDVSFGNGLSVTCKTAYPYGFSLTYCVHGFGELAVRIPEWSDETSYWKNGRICMPFFENGYAIFHVGDGDEIRIFLSGAPKYIYPNPKIPALTAKTCIVRGPLVYCFEEADNGPILPLRIDDEEPIQIGEVNEALGVVTLRVKGYRSEIPSALYTSHRPKEVSCTLTAIPYYAWGNRGENQMRVWMPRTRTEDEA